MIEQPIEYDEAGLPMLVGFESEPSKSAVESEDQSSVTEDQ